MGVVHRYVFWEGARTDILRAAKYNFEMTGTPQMVHNHPHGEPCENGVADDPSDPGDQCFILGSGPKVRHPVSRLYQEVTPDA